MHQRDTALAQALGRLLQRRRRLLAGLDNFERRAEAYRAIIAECETELRSLGCTVQPVVRRKRVLPIKARTLQWVLLRHLREANAPITPTDLTERIVAECGVVLTVDSLRDAQGSVWRGLAALQTAGIARVVGRTGGSHGSRLWEAV